MEEYIKLEEEKAHKHGKVFNWQTATYGKIKGFRMTFILIDSTKTAKDLWDALERQMRSFEYGEQDRKAVILYEYETFKATEGKQFLDTYICYLQVINDLKKCGYKKDNCELNYKFLNNLQPEWKQYGTLMRQAKNLMDINIDALYNILKQNQRDVNDALGYKKKVVVVTSDPLALVAEKTKVSKRKEKVEVQTESEGSDDEDITNKKPEYVKLVEKKEDKTADETKRDMSKVKCYNCKKEGHLPKTARKQSDLDQEINANMVFMAKMEKVLSDSDESSSSVEETIAEVAYYTSESEKIFHDAFESASEKFNENHIASQKDCNESEVDHNDYEEKGHLVDKLIQKFNHKIAKCQKRIKKANQQTKDLENQNKDLQDKNNVLINQVNNFEEKNNEFNEQMKMLYEKNADLLAQTKVLQDQLKVKHVVIDTHTECQAQYAKLEEERYEYMIRYPALCDNDKQHRKRIDEQEILFKKMSRQLVEMNNNVLRLQEKIKKKTKILELKGCVSNKNLEIKKCLERLNDYENKLHKIRQTNQTIHMIMPSKDNLYNGQKRIGFENPSYFGKAKGLRPSLYDDKQTSSLKPYVLTVILEKIIIDLEDEVVSLLEKEKQNLEIIESLKSKGFEASENAISESENQSENDCQVVKKGCDQVENSKVIAPGTLKITYCVTKCFTNFSVKNILCFKER
nr:hypothetical protein [Tanacetum cinerariifolium]